MIRVFIGHDPAESVAWHVLAHSIFSRSSVPVSITPISNQTIPHWQRPRGEYDSTEFSNARFMVPALCDFEGWAIFMDCDMLCTVDINELWKQRDERYAVQVKKHNHNPPETQKFLGQVQTRYSRKNWSSLMLMNCKRCRPLSQHYCEQAPGLDLHGFSWLRDQEIGEIRGDWNHLVGYDNWPDTDVAPELIHWTSGGPWFEEYREAQFNGLWLEEFQDMLGPELLDQLNDD